MTLARWSAAVFVAGYVLISLTATPNPLSALWRPLLVGVAAALVLQVILWMLLRDGDRAAIGAVVVVLVAGAAWVLLAVLVVAATWLVVVQLWRRRRGDRGLRLDAPSVARNLGVFAWAFAAVAAVPVIGWGIGSYQGATSPVHIDANPPDIVVLLMDGYPRADSLVEQFGVDNTPFIAALTARGFTVASHSRSNYTATWASLSSMFHGRYVHEISALAPPPTDPAEQYRRVMLALGAAPVLDGLRARGYEIVTIPSPFESAALTSADRILAPAEWTSFELSLLQHSLAGQLAFRLAPNVVFDQHRARLTSTLRLLEDELARTSEKSRFVFAHLLAPHAPVVFTADGAVVQGPACFPGCNIYGMTSEADWEAFPGQVRHVNELVLTAVDRIVGGDPEAIVILLSDHGSARTGAAAVNAFRNFFAARVPGGEVAYEDDVTPLTVLARLTDLPYTPGAPYAGWTSAAFEPLSLTPYSGPGP